MLTCLSCQRAVKGTNKKAIESADAINTVEQKKNKRGKSLRQKVEKYASNENKRRKCRYYGKKQAKKKVPRVWKRMLRVSQVKSSGICLQI